MLIGWLRSRIQSQRGQVLLMWVGLFTVMMLMAAVAIDVGLWLSERRGAQKDADLTSLAGAYELLDESSLAADAEAAVFD